jgi:hypothetical protein
MGKHGTELGADLAKINQTGAQLVPHLADQFGAARSKLTPIGDDAASWTRDASLGIGATGAHGAFSSFIEAIGAHLKSTEENLDDTGKALCFAATDFAETDAAARTEFDKHKNDVVS